MLTIGTTTASGWAAPKSLTPAAWLEAGRQLASVQQGRQWWVGDWWNAGLAWGDGRQACEQAGIDYQAARDCAFVAQAFQLSRRRDNLTFTHHREVCAITDVAAREHLLDAAAFPLSKGGRAISTRELRKQVRALLENGKDGTASDSPHGPLVLPPGVLTYASVCSGIEGASVAWEDLGWLPVWFSEIDPFCSELLAENYPDVPNLGDMTAIGKDESDAAEARSREAWMSSSAEPLASPSASTGLETAWMTLVANSRSVSSVSLLCSLPGGSSGRTSPAPCRTTKEGLLAPCSGGWLNAGMGGRTGSWTLRASEYPRGAAGCSLSAVLEDALLVPPQSYLTPRQLSAMAARLARHEQRPPPELEELLSSATRATLLPSSAATGA